ncbi:13669_t:CDS:2 [Funneliformis mosseae]|uniref:13669_t:CDS:1 n=1 Tax=Funneliformis mosseae TaxID=27381 RepID=A0A9N8V328_FUNMO|nr:13669_t:CDS:2 [Funneliformis mosseae]
MLSYKLKSFVNHSYLPTMESPYHLIAESLETLGENFLEYENKFIYHGYIVKELSYLNMKQLKDIGITKLGHCIRILVALGLCII